VKAKPSAREDKIEKINNTNYVVHIKTPPIGGKANVAIITLLANYFKVNPALIEIISGHKARIKVIEINN